jgi:predicted SnoaL-like aldol condensation-catalyzing enzyme
MNRYPCVSSESVYSDEERRNLDIVMAFYEQGVNRHDAAAVLSYVGADLTQHSPHVADGPQGLAAFFGELWKVHPEFRVEVKRIFIEGDMTAAHVRIHGGSTPNGEAGVDIFRLKNGKIVEHWDVVRPIPAGAANANSMF